MKRLFPLLLLICAIGADAAALPIGSDANWSTDLFLRNTAGVPVSQKIGHLTYSNPGFDPIVIEPVITLAPGETRRIVKASRNFDRGMWILDVDPRVDASAYLSFNDVTKFEVLAVQRPLVATGDSANFYRVATSFDPPTGTYPVVMNTGKTPVQIEFQTYGPKGEVLGDQSVTASPGITLSGILALAPDGASVRACLGACGIGAGAAGAPVYVFAVVGPPSGSTQMVRYPQ